MAIIDIPKIPLIKGNGKKAPRECGKKEDEPLKKVERILKIYKAIISRYREMIEEKEKKTIPELKMLIQPENPAVLSICNSIKANFRPYIYKEHFLKAAELCHDFVKEEIANEVLPVDFWMRPEEILEIGAADEVDKAIFLCSLLIALENKSAKVLIESAEAKRAFVIFEFGGDFYLIDPVRGEIKKGKHEDFAKSGSYEFNNQEYNEFSD